MRTFYVLWDGSHYLYEYSPISYGGSLGFAMRFRSLPQALEFIDSSGLQLEVLRVDVTSVYTPNLFTEKELK